MKLSELIATFTLQSRGRGWIGLGVLCLLLLGGVVVLVQVPALMRSLNAPTKVEVQPITGDDLKARTEMFRKTLTATAEKVTTRSPFYPPKPKAPPPPPTPTRYSGPAIIGMVSDTVFFADGKRLGVGSPGEAGLSVVSIDPPWAARLKYNGAEFTVGLFDREPVKLNTGLGGPTTPPGMTGEATPRSSRAGSGTGSGGGGPEVRGARSESDRSGTGGAGGSSGQPSGGGSSGSPPSGASPEAAQPTSQSPASGPTTEPASGPANGPNTEPPPDPAATPAVGPAPAPAAAPAPAPASPSVEPGAGEKPR